MVPSAVGDDCRYPLSKGLSPVGTKQEPRAFLAALYHGPSQSPHFPDPFPHCVRWVIHPRLCIFKQGNLGEGTEVSLLHLKNRDLALKPERVFLSVCLSDDEGCIHLCLLPPSPPPAVWAAQRRLLWVVYPAPPALRGGWCTVFSAQRGFMY